jgi:beta-galactosidase
MQTIIRNRRSYVAIIVGLSLAWTICGTVLAENRESMRIDDNWRFHLGDPEEGGATSLDDSDWRVVTLPHDWSIEGKMDPKAPMGGAGGFLPAGIGWYRFHLKAPTAWQGMRVRVEFAGVYMNASIYLNGQKLDFHPYGFTSFFVDLTPVLKIGGDNLLAVRVDNSAQKNCRWYSGSGIYRHVWLEVTNPIQVAPWGVFVSTKEANAQAANISVQTTLLNQTSASKTARIVTIIRGPLVMKSDGPSPRSNYPPPVPKISIRR